MGVSTTTHEQANFRHLVRDIAWFGVALAASTRFLSVYAIRLGASPSDLGWLAALPSLILFLAAGWGSWWLRHNTNVVRANILPGLGFRLSFLLPAFAPFLPAEWQPLWLIIAVSLPALPQGLSSVAFLVMMRQAVSPNTLTNLLSRRALAMNITIAIGALLFGLMLESLPFPHNYQLMFSLAFLATLISLWHVGSVRVEHAPPMQTLVSDARPWHDRAFQVVALIIFVTHLAFFSIVPVVPLQLVENLGAAEGYMAIFGLIELAAGAFAAAEAGKLVSRLGNRGLITCAMLGTAAAAVIIALAPSLWLALPAAALTGGSWTLVGIALFGYFSEVTPGQGASRYTTAYMQAVALAMFVGPLIGSQIAQQQVPFEHVLLLGVGLRLIAAFLVTERKPKAHQQR